MHVRTPVLLCRTNSIKYKSLDHHQETNPLPTERLALASNTCYIFYKFFLHSLPPNYLLSLKFKKDYSFC